MVSYITGLETVAKTSFSSLEITEDGKTYLQALLSKINEAVLSKAFHFAKSAEDNAVESVDIQSAARFHFHYNIFRYAASEGMRQLGKAKLVPDPEQDPWNEPEFSLEEIANIMKTSDLSFPVVEIYEDMKIRDSTVRVGFRSALFLAAMLEYLSAELIELGSKGLNGEKLNAQHIQAALDADPELKATFFPASNEPIEAEAIEAGTLLNEILTILKVDHSTLTPATEEAMQELEAKMELPIPNYLKACLLICNGSNGIKNMDVHLFPSVEDMEEQFFYNRYLPKIYRMNQWIPYRDLDYDFCWEILEVNNGGVILQYDIECNNFWQYGTEDNLLTFLKRLRLYRDYLLTLTDPAPAAVTSQLYKEYEKSCGYGSNKMIEKY